MLRNILFATNKTIGGHVCLPFMRDDHDREYADRQTDDNN